MTKMLSEIREQPQVLRRIERENAGALDALMEDIGKRDIRHIIFAGRGTSDHASIYGGYLLSITKGLVTALAMPSCVTLYNSSLNYSSDLVVGVSQSGRAADALAVLEQGRKSGAVTVSITNDRTSPLAGSAQHHLFCAAGPELSVAATKTFTAEMYVMALLAARWSGNEKLLAALRALPDKIEETLEQCEDAICEQAERYRYITEGFVLSRGLCYPIALESALKIQETCYVKMKGYASSDFYHGPLAQIDPDVPVILLAPEGSAFNDIKAIADKLTGLGVAPLVVTNNKALAAGSAFSILLPDTGCEATQAFLFAVFAQRFAESLSVSKGLDPDTPRLLHKVTITK